MSKVSRDKKYKLEWWRVVDGLWIQENKIIPYKPDDKEIQVLLPKDVFLDGVTLREV